RKRNRTQHHTSLGRVSQPAGTAGRQEHSTRSSGMKFRSILCAVALSLAGPCALAQDQAPAEEQTSRDEQTVVEATPPQSDAADPLKIFISADMEGVVGVVTDEQIGPGGFEYERFRGFMTAEVNACIEAAREAGATEILIADSHGNGQ